MGRQSGTGTELLAGGTVFVEECRPWLLCPHCWVGKEDGKAKPSLQLKAAHTGPPKDWQRRGDYSNDRPLQGLDWTWLRNAKAFIY